MPTIKHPSLLIDLGHVGDSGLPMNDAPWFRQELDLCREWGFQLRILNERVSLVFDHEQLVPYWIQKETPARAWDWLRVNGFFRLESTNSEALGLARRGAPGGTLVYAEEQTTGRGRNGRTWISRAQSGLYFSVVLRPTQPVKRWPLLTHVASVALAETLKGLFAARIVPRPLDVDIKWPNDVLLSGRKCAGILLEMTSEGDSHAAVVGVGVNVHAGSVPESLRDAAVCVDEAADAIVPRRELLVRFLQNLQQWFLAFERGQPKAILDAWRSNSSMWDRTPVVIVDGETTRRGLTCGLDEGGALLVRTEQGALETIISGDISVRPDVHNKDAQ